MQCQGRSALPSPSERRIVLGHHRTLLSRRRSTWPGDRPFLRRRLLHRPLDEREVRPASAHRPFTDILVPLDGSADAERALAPALELATRTGVPLRLLRQSPTSDKDVAADYLAGPPIAMPTGPSSRPSSTTGRASPTPSSTGSIWERSCACRRIGRGGVARAVMGSVAEAVLRWLDRPALVVGPHVSDEAIFSGRAVACIDGSTSPADSNRLGGGPRCSIRPCGWWRSGAPGSPGHRLRPRGHRPRDDGVVTGRSDVGCGRCPRSSPAAAEALAWHPLDDYEGVDYKLLWRSGGSVAGLMRLAPGGVAAPHGRGRTITCGVNTTHRRGDGRAGRSGRLRAIPAGVDHSGAPSAATLHDAGLPPAGRARPEFLVSRVRGVDMLLSHMTFADAPGSGALADRRPGRCPAHGRSPRRRTLVAVAAARLVRDVAARLRDRGRPRPQPADVAPPPSSTPGTRCTPRGARARRWPCRRP